MSRNIKIVTLITASAITSYLTALGLSFDQGTNVGIGA